MLRKISIAGATLAVAAGGLMLGSGASQAATASFTPAAGSSVSCHFTAKVKLSVKLKNDWKQSQHQSDPDAGVRAVPDTQFATNGPVTTTSKGKSIDCTGFVVNPVGGAHFPVTAMKIASVQNGTDPGEATCAGLVPGPSSPPFTSTISYKVTGAKIPDSVVTSTLAAYVAPDLAVGFELTATNITGSFASGSSDSKAFIDQTTLAAFTGSPSTSTTPSTSVCEAQLKIKPATTTKPESVKLKGGKGLSKIGIGPGYSLTTGQPTGDNSSLSISN
jgi:hypothetical protein